MDTQKMLEVRKKIKKGYSVGEIQNELRKEGYSEEEIQACIEVKQYQMASWYLVFGLLFSLCGFYLLIENNSWLLLSGGVVLLSFYYSELQKKKEGGN